MDLMCWARTFAIVFLLGTAFCSSPVLSQQDAQPKPSPEYPSIKNFFRVNNQFCTGGQPPMEDLARMKDEGIRAVLNLRRPSEYNAEEEIAKAKSLGLRYFTIPVDSAAPRDDQADEFLKILADPQNRPLFLHCITNNRASAFWMIRRVLVEGMKIEDAEAEAKKAGLHSQNLIDFARSYIERHAKRPR
jgi:uncharacterized protein (TIGR01244 family)